MKEQVMAWAKQAGIDAWWESGNERREELDDLLTTLATLVRNAALEEAAKECEALTQSTPNGFTLEQKITFSKPSQEITLAIAAIRSMKEKL